MRFGRFSLSLVAVALFLPRAAVAAGNTTVDPASYQALRYRLLGPSRGGRSTAVAGVPGERHTFYLGTSGGLWKTTDAGTTWSNVSDGFFESGSIGAVAVADSDPNVVYAGTGQACLRGNVSAGVGLYKSTDGGKTWRHSGLREAGQIARIRIHPRDADLLYVAAVGRAFGPNPERGVFRSKDGGKSWEKVLFVSNRTGAVDLAMDVRNPRVLYAAAWTGDRKPWTIVSGSAESGLYKSSDGGDTWKKLSGGLPQGVVGRIGVAVSPANPDRVWALVEAAERDGLYRSDDAGETWVHLKTNARRRLYQRTWYYQHIVADPRDGNRVYVMNVDSFRSEDGGKSFDQIQNLPHGDGHDLWINPTDNDLMILGNDGGGTVSLDGGKSWSAQHNQPTAEIYYVAVDERFPYNVYGAQQDNSTIRLPSRYPPGLTPTESWRDVGGCECGHIAFDPRNPAVVYAGCYGGEITRKDLASGEWRDILAYPQMEVGLAPRELRYRFNWNAPIRLSPHDPKVLYHCSQFVHRSTDEGQSWQVVSPDLSRNQKEKQDYAGSPITYENTGVEVNSNILSFEESPATPGLLWAGSDDGLVHVSKDGGGNWENVTPRGLPEWASIQSIELSGSDPARALIAAHRYRLDDFRPFLYLTGDYGRTWRLLTDGRNGVPADTPTRVVREDPERKGLLYAGTERGIYVSFDEGAHWQSLQLNLPLVPITDLKVHRGDLVVSTQGRSFWVLDDLTPLRQAGGGASGAKARLLEPRDAYRADQANLKGLRRSLGENPPYGAVLFYCLAAEAKDEVLLEILGPDGKRVQLLSSEKESTPNPPEVFAMTSRPEGDKKLTKKAGLNRFVWDLRHPVVDIVPDAIVWGFTGGPAAMPGTYQARLTVGDFSQTQAFQVLPDPRISTTAEQYREQLELMLVMRGALDDTYDGVRACRSVRDQAREVVRRLKEAGRDTAPLSKLADSLADKLTAIENELMQTKNEADQDVENFPTKIDNQLAYVYGLVGETDAPPTDGQVERFRDLKKELDAVLARLAQATGPERDAFNEAARALGAAPVLPPR
ncbi:MAG: VPS10 domain-containing protein [Thermoanaerobaculia bacterium]